MTEGPRAGVKTLAIRLPDELHAQLVLLAQFEGSTLTDAIRQAIEQFIERQRTEGDLAGRAAEALAEIEREVTARREAIQALFGTGQSGEAAPTDPQPSPKSERPKARSRRGGGGPAA